MSDTTYDLLTEVPSPFELEHKEDKLPQKINEFFDWFLGYRESDTMDNQVKARFSTSGQIARSMEIPDETRHVVVPPTRTNAIQQFRCIGKWECRVTQIGEESFSAELQDLLKKNSPYVATFSKAHIYEDDLPLFFVGAEFYWSIGDQTSGGGSRRVSEIRFRRMAKWKKRDFEDLESRRKRLFGRIKTIND